MVDFQAIFEASAMIFLIEPQNVHWYFAQKPKGAPP
jgi:hypothetical protein